MKIKGHSLHINSLQDELTKTLARLTVTRLDFFLIQQPEIEFGNNVSAEQIYLKLEKIFLWLEDEVSKGRISHYGISSAAFVLPSNHPKFLSLEEIIRVVHRSVGKKNHFSMIQVPFNLFESGFIVEKNQYDDSLSVSELAEKEGIACITYRPLRSSKDFRFIDYDDHAGLYFNF